MIDIMNLYSGMKLFVSIETKGSRFGFTLTVRDIIVDNDSFFTILGTNGEELAVDLTDNVAVFSDEDGVEINYNNGSTIYISEL